MAPKTTHTVISVDDFKFTVFTDGTISVKTNNSDWVDIPEEIMKIKSEIENPMKVNKSFLIAEITDILHEHVGDLGTASMLAEKIFDFLQKTQSGAIVCE